MTDLVDAMTERDKGIKQAEENANLKHTGWSDIAFDFLLEFLDCHEQGVEFMAEDVRKWAKDCPYPPSFRAWGAVLLRAAREKLIEKAGYRETTNPLAHRTPATLWRKV